VSDGRCGLGGFRHPWAFWSGVAGVTAGVALHVPMFLGAKDDHYMLSGMPWDRWMILGMGLMLAGYALVLYGLSPRFSRGATRQTSELEFEGLDEGKLSAAHIKLMIVLTLGVAIDTQKPFTFTFILPGVANEYNLRSPSHPAPGHWPVALFPFVAIVGTVLGSLIWGVLGDSIGRRAAILLAATLFIGTAMCSAMPAFHWNLVACFFMGMSAGGLLPIVYALLAETIPRRRRGEAIVFVAGIGTALGFLLASWTAHWLIPTYGWRIMWFFGVPTGLALILLNRYIPESPRFLFANGRDDEARDVMRSFGVTVTERPVNDTRPAPSGGRAGIASVFRRPYRAITPVLILYGLAWGLVNFGFLVWLPIYASKSGVSAGHVTTILAKAALFAIPGSIVVAWLYGRWSSRGTLVLAAALEAAALVIFAVDGSAVVDNSTLFTAALVVLLISMWATISALAPYSSEIYATAIRGAGTGVVAGATKLSGVLALAIAVAAWAPPSLAGAALLAAVPAGLAAVLLVFVGVETRGRSLEEISEAEAATARTPRERALRFRGVSYPIILPSWKDPRLLLSTTFVCLHTLGQVEFHFALSIPQILAPLLTCGIIEGVVAFRQKRVIMWPASALLTGNGIAFILRIPGTQHGDWWSFHGIWIYVGVAAISMLSKYLIKFRGRHVFNPSNFGLVLCFLVLGSTRVEPLQFWWGPLSPALVIVLGTIIVGALVILSRVGLLAVACLFWVTFAAGLGILTLSGHAFSANWHLGPVADAHFWKVLVTSPEVFIFLSFMITDPQTAPRSQRGRRIYAVTIGLLSVLLIAPQTTEFAAKVALLATLTIVCAARPLIILGRERLARRGTAGAVRLPRRPALGAAVAVLGAAVFAGLVVVAGSPARSLAGVSAVTMSNGVSVSIASTPGLVRLDRTTGNRAAADAIDDLRLTAQALSRRSVADLTKVAGGTYLTLLTTQIAKSDGRSIVVPTYQVHQVSLKLQRAVGQAPPTVVATVNGFMTPLTYAPKSTTPQSGATTSFAGVFDLSLSNGRFLIIGNGTAASRPAVSASVSARVNASKGMGDFTKVRLSDVARKVGLNFRQDAFRYSWSYDTQAMMGGGVCWLDYNNDGWLDLFAVNSYADVDLPEWDARGGLPQSALFENVHGKFVNVDKSSGAGIRVKGTGCVAADLNGDGYTDLLVTSATGATLLWNNGNGTFTQGTRAAGIDMPYNWYSGAAVADVNGDGRPDIFISGYTDMADPITTSVAGFPENYVGVRDLLFLNEGNGPNGRARFKEVGVKAGIESANFSHGLGAVFTDVNGDGRPDLFVANDGNKNQLYLNEPGGPLGFHFVNVAKAWGVDYKAAGMGVAEGDYNGDGLPDLFVTNSRGQPHAAYQSTRRVNGKVLYANEMARFGKALARGTTVGWGDSWDDFDNDGKPDLIIANGAIPVTNVKKDTEPIQVLQNLGDGKFTNASGVISPKGLPKIIGRGLAAADFDNDGRLGVAINSIAGPLVLLKDTGATGHWLEVALDGFYPDAVITAQLPNGRKVVQELHAGSSYLSSEDPRAHFGLGGATTVTTLTIRYPNGSVKRLHDVAANQILTVKTPAN
jgi:MFS transporter, putative metabolite:H+ symporter